MPDYWPNSHPARLCLLGHWALSVPADTPFFRVSVSARRLLALLALRGQSTRGELRGILWPELSESAAAARLRNALWRLAGARGSILQEHDDGLSLAPAMTTDVQELLAAAERVDAGLQGIDHHQFESDLLPSWGEDWLVVDRERIRQARLHALEQISEGLLVQGRYRVALDAALAALEADPLRETAHRAVIRVHLAEGNVSEALQQYDRCRSVLASSLGLPPSKALCDLVPGRLRPLGQPEPLRPPGRPDRP